MSGRSDEAGRVRSAMGPRVWAVALNTFREAVRNRVLYVLALFAVGLMAFSVVLGELSMHEEIRVIKDLGLFGISFVGVVIALFLGVNLLSKELDRKTVYFVIPKPLRRFEFLLGKYLGQVLTLTVLVTLMAAILAIFVLVQGGSHGVVMVRAEVLVLVELCLLTAVAMLFSSFSSPYLSAMFTGALWVIGRNRAELLAFATGKKLGGTPLGTVLEACADVVPDFHALYVSGSQLPGGDTVVSVHESFVSWGYVAEASLYGLLYAAACLVGAMVLFARRDLV
ncbi:ABC transporter permease [Paraliomyxa miuraensis]|uniref:ABC transporter permease n=1 Tax=Paraliomyxa miuraensis TaxID=376150 RepID=UPI00224C7D2A|nr:ABC transporter permease [Paraliomyxa miuraensis]MCX4241388.1 ABC transporter permease [Paraliomyxa miuraensis]